MRLMYLVLAGLITAACTGSVTMYPLDPDNLKQTHKMSGTEEEITKAVKKRAIEGIIVYRAVPMVEVSKFIQVNLPGPPPTLSSDCEHIPTRKIVSIPDWEHPYRLYYNHGFLETYTFAATLTNDGILTNINTQSTPDQGKTLQNLASAASSAATTAVGAPLTPKPLCTVTSVFVGYEQLPAQATIPPYNTLCKSGVTTCP